jgi:transcriptional regulator with XRE-family HTH domain
MVHTQYYGSKGPGRLARDAGVARSTVMRFLRGESNPSVFMVLALLDAIQKQLDRDIDLRELISLDGSYPTPSVCDLMGCPGCLPPEAYTRDGTIKSAYRHMKGGEWSVTSAPNAPARESDSDRRTLPLPNERAGNGEAPRAATSNPSLLPPKSVPGGPMT